MIIYWCRQWELAFKRKGAEVIYLRKIVSLLKLYCTFHSTMKKETHIPALQISEKDWMILNPWLSGRGAFPGRMDIFTSNPAKMNKFDMVCNKNKSKKRTP